MKGLSILAVLLAVLLCCATANADGLDDLIVALGGTPQATAALEQCACGDSCPCASGGLTAQAVLQARATEMAKWTWVKNSNGSWTAWPKSAARAAPVSYREIVTAYGEAEPVCINGQCELPSSGYTSGYYTRSLPSYSTPYRASYYANPRRVSQPARYGVGPVRRIFGGGFRSCGPDGCN